MSFTFPDSIRRHAQQRPDKLAMTDLTDSLTYARLHEDVGRVAAGLDALGVRPGDRVVFVGRNSLTFYELLYGAVTLGAVTAPLNWRMTAPEIAQLIDDAQAGVVVYDTEFEHLVPTGGHRIRSGSQFHAWRDQHEFREFDRERGPDDVVLQSYTSGTTGLPKGVLITNRMLEISTDLAKQHWNVDENTVSGVTMPCYHVGGTTIPTYTIITGGTAVVTAQFDPDLTLDLIEIHGITFLPFAPVMVAMLAEAQRAKPRDVSSLKCVMYGGQPITSKALKAIFDTFDFKLTQSYGMTEVAGGPITMLERADHFGPLRTSGRPRRSRSARSTRSPGSAAPRVRSARSGCDRHRPRPATGGGRRRPRRCTRRAAGCARATPGTSTRTDSCSSWTGSRT